MSKQLTIIDMKDEILSTESEFTLVSQSMVNFRREYQYSMQALEKNSFLLKTAIGNPQSLRSAIVNVAGVGLTLNSAERLCYLVPRDNMVCLDISYIGLLKLAILDGGILWCQAKSVRKNDRFELKGFDKEPIHTFDPFSDDRGDIIGVYCVARTSDGSFLTTTMTLKECHDIRDRTTIWQKTKSGPWKSDEEAMCLKTVIKRGSKLWPKGSTSRLDKAIEVINEHEGIDFTPPPPQKISEASNKLNDKLGAQVDPESKKVIDSILLMCKNICLNHNKKEKQDFMLRELQVSSFNELYQKDLDYLIELEKHLIEITPTDDPTMGIAWDEEGDNASKS